MKTLRIFGAGLFLFGALMAAPAFADDHAGHEHAAQDHTAQDHAGHERVADDQGDDQADRPGYELAEDELAHTEDAVAHGHHADHVPHFSDINWFHGLIGEKEGVEPSLLWRPPGTPIPLGALIINTAILFFLIGRFGGPGIRQGLVDRKERIAGDIEKAAKMKAEAEEQLGYYEQKLAEMEAEMQRIKKEMQEQAEADRERIIAEAKERRGTIEAEARQLIEQELTQARHEATLKAVSSAVAAAREQVVKSIGTKDHERLTNDFLGSLEAEAKKATEARS